MNETIDQSRHIATHENVGLLIVYVCHELILDDRGHTNYKDNMSKMLWRTGLDCSLHRQTAVNVRFTDGELKLLSPSEPSSNPPDFFN